MDREQYSRAERVLGDLQRAMQNPSLTASERKALEEHAAALSGVLSSPWLPVSNVRRLAMAVIVALGIQQVLWFQNFQPLLWWLLLPLFSPRIVGEAIYLAGRTAGWLRR